jgi:hypothetical protein
MFHVKVTMTIPDPSTFNSFEKQIPVASIEIIGIGLNILKLLL